MSLNMIMTILLAFFVLKGVFSGFLKGFARKLVHLVFVAASAVGAYFLTDIITTQTIQSMGSDSVASFLGSFGMDVGGLEKISPYFTAWNWLIELPVRVIAAPFIFMAMFFALKIVGGFLSWLFCFIFRVEKPFANPFKRLAGAVVGAIEGVLILFVILVPITAMSNIVNDSMDVIKDKNVDGKYDSMIEFYDDNISPITNHKVIELVNKFGGEQIIDSYAVITLDNGEEVNLIEEGTTVVSISIELFNHKSDSLATVTDGQKELFRYALEEMNKSTYLATLASNLLSDLGRAVQDGVIPISAPAPFDQIFNPMISIFATSNRDNVYGDIDTILDVYFILADSGALSAYGTEGGEDDMKNALTARDEEGKTIISRVTDRLNENERTRPLVTTLTEMTITMLAGQLAGDYDVAAVYDSLKDDFHNVLTVNREDYANDEEYVAARDAEVNKALTDNGIEMEADTVTEIGDYIDEHYGDKDELTNEDINSILLHYYEVTAANGGELPEELPEDVVIPELPAN